MTFADYNAAKAIIGGNLCVTTKMPCLAHATSPKKCRRGSKLRLVPGSVCSLCYARRGRFLLHEHILDARQQAMDHPQWSEAMGLVLSCDEHSGHFRWYSAGDMRHLADLLKICDVARRTPHIRHWLPTHEVGILGAFKRSGGKYPRNLLVRLSADMVDQPTPPKLCRQLGVLACSVSKTNYDCPAETQAGRCLTCRRCWDKSIPCVTYKLK